MASPSSTRNTSPVVTAALIALGLVLAIVGVIYLIDTAGHLPSFFPGHQPGSAHHHTKHALLAFGLALLAFIGAWMSAGKKTSH